jgi:replicative DNA helicase
MNDAERALLSALVLSPDNVDRVSSVVSAADFADSHLGDFYAACVMTHEAGLPIGDPKVLLPELRRAGVDESVSNTAFVGRLLMDGQAAHADFYAHQVADAAKLRRYESIGRQMANMATREDASPKGVADWFDGQMATVGQSDTDDILTADESADNFLNDLCTTKHRDRIIMTGVPSVDTLVGGWLPGELIVLGRSYWCGQVCLCDANGVARRTTRQVNSVLLTGNERP